jgi:hypothetical protein
MFPQQFQGQAFPTQGVWGNAQFAPQGLNLNDVVNAIARILPLLQLQASQFVPQTQTGAFPQGLVSNPLIQSGLPFQASPWAGQPTQFGYTQFAPQATNLVDVVNVLSRVLPVLQQTSLLGQQGNVFGFPQQHFATQGINPEIAGVISRILPFLGTQANPFFQTAGTGYGSHGNPYIH